MRFIFLANATVETGAGHVMRISAIAESAKLRGIECLHVGNIFGLPWLNKRLSNINLQSKTITSVSDSELNNDDILIVDSYDFTSDLLQLGFISKFNKESRILISDSSTPVLPAELYIYPSLSVENVNHSNGKKIVGPSYIPLRQEITKVKYKLHTLILDKLVIFGGGTDMYHFAENMALLLRDFKNFNKAIFYTKNANDITSIDSRYTVKDFGSSLDFELSNTNLVFTTSSTSSFEIIAREIPMGVVHSVDNQIEIYDYLGKHGLAAQIGFRESDGVWKFHFDTVKKLIDDYQFRLSIQKKIAGLLDLKGADRIVEEIVKFWA